MKKVNCVYTTSKYKLRNISFEGHFFNPEDFIRRISKTDHTNEPLSNDAINAHIYKKMQRIFEDEEKNTIFYVIRNLEFTVIENIHSMITQIYPDGEFEFNFFILEEELYLLENLPTKLIEFFDYILIFEQKSLKRKKHILTIENKKINLDLVSTIEL